MLDVETVNAIMRHQRLEIETLEGTQHSLSEKVCQLKEFVPQQESFQATLRRLPILQEECNAFFDKLKSIAKERLEKNQCDVCAMYCLYLLNSLATIERANEELEELYVQTKFGQDLVNPSSQISFTIPTKMDRITERYTKLKEELSVADSHLKIAQKANESMRKELEESRSRYTKMASSIPNLARRLETKIQEIDTATKAKEQQYQAISERLQARVARAEQRTTLINEMITQLTPEFLQLPDGKQQQLLGSLRSILTAANDVSEGSDAAITSHSRALCSISASGCLEKTPEQPRSPILPPKLDNVQRARQVRAMLAMLSPKKM